MMYPVFILNSFIKSSYKRPSLLSLLIWVVMAVFNGYMIYFFFKNSKNVFLLSVSWWICMGIALAARDIYSAFLEKTGKSISILEEIGIYLIFEIWFLISLIYIIIGQILYAIL